MAKETPTTDPLAALRDMAYPVAPMAYPSAPALPKLDKFVPAMPAPRD